MSYQVFLPFVSSSQGFPQNLPATEIVFPPGNPALPSPSVAVLLVVGVIFLIILLVIAEGKRNRLSSFSPEQQSALILQNRALTLWALVLFTGVCLCPLFSSVPSLQDATASMGVLIVLFGGTIMAFIALSSIFAGASILRHRGQREFSKDGQAVWQGIGVLMILGIVLFAWLTKLGR